MGLIFFANAVYYDVGVKRYLKSALFGLLSHVLAGPKVMHFHAGMKRMTF